MSLSFLIEGRRENILDRFSENPELLGVVEEFLDYEFNIMTNYKYVDWVMRKNFDDTGNLIIPFNEIISYLERFDNIRKNLDKKDINQYNSIEEFVDTIEKYGYDIADLDKEEALTKKILIRQYAIETDIHPYITGVEFSQAWRNKVRGELEGEPVFFPSLDDLIEMKKAAGRPKDLEDLKVLKKIKQAE